MLSPIQIVSLVVCMRAIYYKTDMYACWLPDHLPRVLCICSPSNPQSRNCINEQDVSAKRCRKAIQSYTTFMGFGVEELQHRAAWTLGKIHKSLS